MRLLKLLYSREERTLPPSRRHTAKTSLGCDNADPTNDGMRLDRESWTEGRSSAVQLVADASFRKFSRVRLRRKFSRCKEKRKGNQRILPSVLRWKHSSLNHVFDRRPQLFKIFQRGRRRRHQFVAEIFQDHPDVGVIHSHRLGFLDSVKILSFSASRTDAKEKEVQEGPWFAELLRGWVASRIMTAYILDPPANQPFL